MSAGRKTLGWVWLGAQLALPVAAGLHTFDGSDAIDRIDGIAVYFVPKDRVPLPDWRRRVEYYARRLEAFHGREFAGQSRLRMRIPDQPFRAAKTAAEYESADANQTYFSIVNESRSLLPAARTNGFPILLVFADLNHCPYDDWRRVCLHPNCACPGHPDACRGFVDGDGVEHPGSPCGGARSTYWPEEHFGAGLITADGWRVPVKGTDCVVYHEGIGHAIGLPHPEPMNDSVMGTAQYCCTLAETWIDVAQKQALGWRETPGPPAGLFATLRVRHAPIRPKAGEAASLIAEAPAAFSRAKLVAEFQTPNGKWIRTRRPALVRDAGLIRWRFPLPAFRDATPVGYRVVARAGRDQTEVWGYLRVVAAEAGR